MKEFARKFYQSEKWRHCRETYIGERLMIDGGVCERCREAPGNELHHIEPLSIFNIDNPEITINPENLRWLCKDCHFAVHKELIMKGFQKRKRTRILSENGTWFDDDGRIHKQEVIIVYGAPASGKSTYVNQHKCDSDMVIDIDRIKKAFGASERDDTAGNLLDTVLDVRDHLYCLIDQGRIDCKRIWIVAGLPDKKMRNELQQRFHAELIFMDKTYEECVANANADPDRKNKLFQEYIIRHWFENYQA